MRIDLENAKKEFVNYTSKYDTMNENISRKIGHSIRVMNISNEIAKKSNLKENDVEMATLIGLLHDIGRFEQYKRFNTFKDKISVDHGDLGVEILKSNDYIKKFIEDDECAEIVIKAIKNHNKYKIEENLSDREMLFCKLIRDADKIDILYEATEMFWKNEENKIENEKISKQVEEEFFKLKTIQRSKNMGDGIDKLVIFVAFIFDINFEESFRILETKDYINKILDRFRFNDEETQKKMEKIRNIAKDYIKAKGIL